MFFFFKQKTAYEIMPSLVGSEMCIRDRLAAAALADGGTRLRGRGDRGRRDGSAYPGACARSRNPAGRRRARTRLQRSERLLLRCDRVLLVGLDAATGLPSGFHHRVGTGAVRDRLPQRAASEARSADGRESSVDVIDPLRRIPAA